MANEYPPYIPMPSLGHELGLMFGFFSLCIAVMATYVALWRVSQNRLRAEDLARRKASQNKGIPQHSQLGTTTSITAGSRSPSPTKSAAYEKLHTPYTIPEDRFELPVHGMEMFKSEKAMRPRMGPLNSHSPLSPLSPMSPRSFGSGSTTGIGMMHTPRDVVGSVGNGSEVDSIVGLALSSQQSRSQSPVRVELYRSMSPTRRLEGQDGPVEIGPEFSQR